MSRLTYKDAGVDRSVSELAKDSIKEYAAATHSDNVLKGIGLFSGFYELDLKSYQQPVLVSSIDGVGTKVKIAEMMQIYDTVGQDLVNHSINDIMVCGARPLFFMDYLAADKLDAKVVAEIVRGIAGACKNAECALVGGETAEMPGVYAAGNFDVAGAIVGVVEKDKIIDGSLIQAEDVLVGVASNGLHTNGYSLVRKVFFDHSNFTVEQYLKETRSTLGEELLRVHRSYYSLICALAKFSGIKGMAHITGGGIVNNTARLLNSDLSLQIDWQSWQKPAIFQIIQEIGQIPDSDMRATFNLGIGLVLVTDKKDVDDLIRLCLGLDLEAHAIGIVTKKRDV
jgi:phosphoribosylformylglycinamidine cyclo-ligase